jgi:hypothetical protein
MLLKPVLCLGLVLIAAPVAAQVAPLAPVETTALAKDPFSTGLLSKSEGGLGGDLWEGASPATLSSLLEQMPTRPASPSIGAALRRTLLTSGAGPAGASSALGGAKLAALARAGFGEEARIIESLSSAPDGDPEIDEAMAVADLLSGDVEEACQKNARLTRGRDAPFWVKLRILCYAAANELDAAELALGLLREQNALTPADEEIMTPLAAGGRPKTPAAPEGPVHYAALQLMKMPISPALLGDAEAGVVKAAAMDGDADWPTRIAAAVRAVSMGVMSGADLKSLFAAVPLDVAAVSGAAETLRSRSGDPMADVAAYQSIQAMAAPEFLRDKSALIAEAIGAANSFPRAFAASVLYADDIKSLEGAIVGPREAQSFALARMAIGDSDGAAKWLLAMQSGGFGGLAEEEALSFLRSVGLLSTLNSAAAQAVAEAANVAVETPRPALAPSDNSASDMAQIVDAAIDAASARIKGQAALTALAASGAAASGDPVAAVVTRRGLEAAGLGDLAQRYGFEQVWAATFAQDRGASLESPDFNVALAEQPGGLTPRLKPPRNQ